MYICIEFRRYLSSPIWQVVVLVASSFLAESFTSLAHAGSAEAGSEADDILEKLRAEWTSRSIKFNSVKFQWDETREIHVGSAIPPDIAKTAQMAGVDPKLGWPAKMLTVEFPRELILRGTWMKHVNRIAGPSEDGDTYSFTDYQSGYDGESSRNLFVDANSKAGSIRDEDRNFDSADNSLRPLMYFARPFDSEVGMIKPSSLSLAETQPDDGTLVVEADGRRRFVVDSQRDFIILSWVQRNRRSGGKLKEGRVDYRFDDELGWLPTSWELLRYSTVDPSRLEHRILAVVKNMEAGIEYDKSVFGVDFPVGTQVYNHLTKEEFVVLGGGGKRDVSLFKNDGVTLASETEAWSTRRVIFVAVNAAILLILLLYFGIRKVKQNGDP